MDHSTAVVLAGGEPVHPSDRAAVPDGVFIVAADSGLDAAEALDLVVDVVVGDMDSVSPAALERAEAAGVEIDRHPVDKNATDLELALDLAREAGAREIIVLGGHGGRLDHLLGNAVLLTAPRFSGCAIRWIVGRVTVTPCRPGRTIAIEGAPGDRVSILPVGGPATTVVTRGLAWPLAGDDLALGSTRGMSNTMTDRIATVAIGNGVLLVIHERSD